MPSQLFTRYPGLSRTLPFVPICDLPTPVERARGLEREAGSPIWIKRDDLTAPLYGGNKPRKLEFVFADAKRRGATEIVTSGGDGSNHCLATILHGREHGLAVTMITVSQPVLSCVRKNILCDRAGGGNLIHASSEAVLVPTIAAYMIRRRRETGRWPYFLTFGGSSPTGTIGFVDAGLELAAQVAAGELPEPEALFVACGSAGTQAGLIVGLALAGLKTKVIGVRVAMAAMTNRYTVAALANLTARRLRSLSAEVPPVRVAPSDVTVLTEYYGGVYGRPTESGKRAMALVADTEGVPLDPTYTGKAAAGMLGWLAERGAGGPVLFWNTYNSRDLSAVVAGAEPTGLPPGFARYFDAESADADL